MIPKIIHQIAPANKKKWHPWWFKCQESWLNHFSEFKYKLWDDQDEINDFVLTNYPQFANLYNNFPVQIMKIDFARFCILHFFGGLYGDMDYFVYKNFYDQLNKQAGLLENLTDEYTTASVENALMYSTPKNIFFWECMRFSKTSYIHFKPVFKISNNKDWRDSESSFYVNNITGSGMISVVYEKLKNKHSLQLLSNILFNNRPGSYDSTFVGKHLHSSVWGNEYLNTACKYFFLNDKKNLVLCNGEKDINVSYTDINEFDFFYDYTKGNYLKPENLQ